MTAPIWLRPGRESLEHTFLMYEEFFIAMGPEGACVKKNDCAREDEDGKGREGDTTRRWID